MRSDPSQSAQQRRSLPRAASRAVLSATLAWPLAAAAQDYGAMIAQQMNAMNQNIARGQQQVIQIVRQRMQDPQVQAAYQRYVAQSGGRPAMDYPNFTYNYVYTNGFSAQGLAHARANEAGMQAREQSAAQSLRDAQTQRAQAQRDGYARNQQEVGRALMGQGTYVAPNGAPLQLPNSWQKNTSHQHQGQTYQVDAAGQYHVLGANGWWYPVAAP